MPTRSLKTAARRSGVTVADMERYWKRATASYERQMKKAAEGKREKIKEKYPYIMAATLRQVQRTGAHPHKKMSGKPKGKKKKTAKESFASRIDTILESFQ